MLRRMAEAALACLLVDNQLVGDISHDQYVEIQLPAGEHVVEACVGGVRYRQTSLFPTLQSDTAGGEKRDRLLGITVPVDVPANGSSYLNFENSGARVYLANQPAEQGRARWSTTARRRSARSSDRLGTRLSES